MKTKNLKVLKHHYTRKDKWLAALLFWFLFMGIAGLGFVINLIFKT